MNIKQMRKKYHVALKLTKPNSFLPMSAPQIMQTDTNTGTHRHVGYYWVKTPTGWVIMFWTNYFQAFFLDGKQYPGIIPDAQILEVNENRLPSSSEVDNIMQADNWVAMDVPIDILENTPPTPIPGQPETFYYRSPAHMRAYTSKHRKH